MYALIGTLRIAILILITLAGLLAGVFSLFLPASVMSRLSTLWHSCVLRTIGVNCNCYGSQFKPGALLVSNHISWLDISVIGSRFPVLFLANSEIASWPILGWLIRRTGTLFIERGKGAGEALKKLSDSLRGNRSVLIFPEGKTTDGSSVIRFQPRLFQSAIDCAAAVQPIGIRYVDKDGEWVDRLSFHGEIGFLESVWRTVCGGVMHAEIFVFDPVEPGTDRNTLSQDAEDRIRQWVDLEKRSSKFSKYSAIKQ